MAIVVKAGGGKGDFVPCPKYAGRAVCVDVTPLREYETQYGVKQKFKIAFEIDLQDKSKTPAQPWVVMTAPMTPSLNEKAALAKFLKDWFGEPLKESTSLDLDGLIGRPAYLMIVHEKSQDGTKTYANIKVIQPHEDGEPLQPSGLWKRIQDRPPRDGDGERPLTKEELAATKVHVGKFKGTPISDLSESAVKGLAEVWMPKAMAAATITAEDKRLVAAINARLEEIKLTREITSDDDIPF